MTSSRSGIGRYRVIVVGLVLMVGGVAALGCFLTAAGDHSTTGAIVLGALAGVLFIGGFVLLRVSARRRGGVLSADPTPAERRVYRRMYRGPHRSAH
jgi:hypothetical protein